MATDAQWAVYCDATHNGKLTGNAEFARQVRATPLEPDAILNLLWESTEYSGDSYYNVLWIPVRMRVEEYFEFMEKQDDE